MARFDKLLNDPRAVLEATSKSTYEDPALLTEFVERHLFAHAGRKANAQAVAMAKAAQFQSSLDAAILEVLSPHRAARSIGPPRNAAENVAGLLRRESGEWLNERGLQKVPDVRAIRKALRRLHERGTTVSSRTPRR
jgi:hypothetical protein